MAESLRIVIVDDQNYMRTMLKTALVSSGYDVVGMAADGLEAIEVYRKEQPDFILLDVNMPRMGGEEALAAILAEAPSASAIMLTADLESIERCLKTGAVGFVRKDTTLPELIGSLREAFEQRKTGGSCNA